MAFPVHTLSRFAQEANRYPILKRRNHILGMVVAAIVHNNNFHANSLAIGGGKALQSDSERFRAIPRGNDDGYIGLVFAVRHYLGLAGSALHALNMIAAGPVALFRIRDMFF